MLHHNITQSEGINNHTMFFFLLKGQINEMFIALALEHLHFFYVNVSTLEN